MQIYHLNLGVFDRWRLIFKKLTPSLKKLCMYLSQKWKIQKGRIRKTFWMDYNIHASPFHNSGVCLALQIRPILNVTALHWCVCKGSALQCESTNPSVLWIPTVLRYSNHIDSSHCATKGILGIFHSIAKTLSSVSGVRRKIFTFDLHSWVVCSKTAYQIKLLNWRGWPGAKWHRAQNS